MSGDRKNNLKKMKRELLDAFGAGDVNRVLSLVGKLPEQAKKSIPSIVFESMKYEEEYSPLIAAVLHGNYYLCKMLLQAGVCGDVLFMALQEKRSDIAELLIEFGADVNSSHQSEGLCPMYFAIINKNPPSIIEKILLAGFPVDKPVWLENVNAIHIAASANNIEAADVLVKHRADLNLTTAQGDTAVTIAVKGNYHDMVKFLVNNGAELINRAATGCPLYVAITAGHLGMVQLLLELGANVNKGCVPNEPYSPLHIAIKQLRDDIVMLLLEKGADVNSTNIPSEEAPLHTLIDTVSQNYPTRSLTSVRTKIAKVLIDKGTNVNALCESRTPLDCAINAENTEICKLLIREGADVTKKGLIHKHGLLTNRFRYISCVSSFKCPELIKLCLEHGCDYNYHDRHGLTPYHRAMAKHNPEMVKVFWKHGCPFDQPELMPGKMKSILEYKPDAADKNILAVQADFINGIISNNVETVRRALDEGAEPRGCSVKIPSTLHYAAAKGQYEIAKLLLENGVPANMVTEDQTPLNIAAEKNNIHLCSILLQFGACYNYKKTIGDKIIKTLDEGCKHLYSLFKIVYHMFKMAKEGNVRLLTYLKQCIDGGNPGLLKTLINCINRQGLTLCGTASALGHTELAKELILLRIKHL